MFPQNHDHFYGNGHETQFYDQQNADYAYQQTNLSKSGKLVQKIKFFTQKSTGNHSFLSSKFCGLYGISQNILERFFGYMAILLLLSYSEFKRKLPLTELFLPNLRFLMLIP